MDNAPDQAESSRERLLMDLDDEAGARSAAADRLVRREGLIRLATTMATMLLIILSVFLLIIPLPKQTADFVSAASIAASVLLLGISLLQSIQSNPVRAEQFNRSAQEIEGIKREFLIANDSSFATVQRFMQLLDRVLSSYAIRYDDIDVKSYSKNKLQLGRPIGSLTIAINPMRRSIGAIAIVGFLIVVAVPLWAAWHYNRAYIEQQQLLDKAVDDEARVSANLAESKAQVASAQLKLKAAQDAQKAAEAAQKATQSEADALRAGTPFNFPITSGIIGLGGLPNASNPNLPSIRGLLVPGPVGTSPIGNLLAPAPDTRPLGGGTP